MADEMLNELNPNSSEALGIFEPEPEPEVASAEAEERSLMSLAAPIYEELVEWFEEQIAAADSVEQVLKTASAYTVDTETALKAHDLVRRLLESKQGEFKARFDSFKANHADSDE